MGQGLDPVRVVREAGDMGAEVGWPKTVAGKAWVGRQKWAAIIVVALRPFIVGPAQSWVKVFGWVRGL